MQGSHYSTPSSKKERKPVERTKMKKGEVRVYAGECAIHGKKRELTKKRRVLKAMHEAEERKHTQKKLCEVNVSRRASGRGRRNVITWPIRSSDRSESLVIDGAQMSWLQAVDTNCTR